MSELESYRVTPLEAAALRRELENGPEIVPFSSAPELTAKVACLGMQREVGTLNDEMARFVFNADTAVVVPRSSLRSELVKYAGATGLRIWAENYPRLELRFRGLRPLLHPRFSFHPDGAVKQLVIFPRTIAKFLESQGVEAALVRPWGLNTIFGGFDPATHYYQTNFWELENNDTVRFSQMVAKRQIPFLGTHDLVAHISDTRGEAWASLQQQGIRVRAALENYFAEIPFPTIASLVIPYTIGVVLDDLAQPPNYGVESRTLVLDELLATLERRDIPPHLPRVLMKFPSHYEKIILLARGPDIAAVREKASWMVRNLVNEILQNSVSYPLASLGEAPSFETFGKRFAAESDSKMAGAAK